MPAFPAPAFARRAALTIVLSLFAAAAAARAERPPTTVFAAASLKDALDEVVAAWNRDSGKAVRVSYAASSTLAVQIARGAPADVFVSADREWMDDLAAKGLIQPETRVDLLGNRLVLIAPKDAGKNLDLRPGLDLAAALGEGRRLALANVQAVPAGRYAKAALAALGAWEGVKDRLAQADNVRAALRLVARGEAPLGIVYATDAASDPAVAAVGTFPADAHPPIVYPAALLKRAGPAAAAFFRFLRSAPARAVFERYGFRWLPRGREPS